MKKFKKLFLVKTHDMTTYNTFRTPYKKNNYSIHNIFYALLLPLLFLSNIKYGTTFLVQQILYSNHSSHIASFNMKL